MLSDSSKTKLSDSSLIIILPGETGKRWEENGWYTIAAAAMYMFKVSQHRIELNEKTSCDQK